MRVDKKITQGLRKKGIVQKKDLDKWFEKFAAARRRKLARLSEIQRYRCCYCLKPTWSAIFGEDGPKSKMATLEHVVCSGHGGSDSMSNLVMACYGCNSKRNSTFDAFEFSKLIASGLSIKKVNLEEDNQKYKENQKKKLNNRKRRYNDAVLRLAVFLFLLERAEQGGRD